MEPLDFLGGKYLNGTEILSGTIQTFRASDPANGRDVFVHRVASNDPAAQQLALLLSSALIRSGKARRLVLDVVEEDGFAHVVTDTEHQCLLLREWLQFEINQAGGSEPASRPSAPPPAAPAPAPAPIATAAPAAKPNGAPTPPPPAAAPAPAPKQEPGEFTRMFMAAQGGPAPAQATPAPAQATPAPPAQPLAKAPPVEALTEPAIAAAPEPVKAASAVRETAAPAPDKQPGEFTRMFMAATSAAEKEVRPPAPPTPPSMPAPATPQPESRPGEFTRFFQSGVGMDAKSAPPPARSAERPSNPDFARTSVQRPSTPRSAPPPPPPPAPTSEAQRTGRVHAHVHAGARSDPEPAPDSSAAQQRTRSVRKFCRRWRHVHRHTDVRAASRGKANGRVHAHLRFQRPGASGAATIECRAATAAGFRRPVAANSRSGVHAASSAARARPK